MNERARPAGGLPVPSDCPPVAYDRAPTYPRMISEKDVAVPMRDGINLSVDIYRPDAGERFPALLAFAIYNKDLQGPDVAETLPPQPGWSSLWTGPIEAGDTKFLTSRGYVHVIGSPRGVGKSDGGGSRQWDSYDLIEWIAAQPWGDGNVGMVGISGFGAEQLYVARQNPPHLKAIFPFDPRGAYGTLGIVAEATFKLRPVAEDERLLAVPFARLKDIGAAVRALLAGDLLPSAVEILDATAAAALGLDAAVLLVGFDGLREQVDAQARELAALAVGCGGRDTVVLPPATWPRLPAAARDAFTAPAALMTLSVLPALVVDTMEQGAEAARQHGLGSAWAAHAGVGVLTAALAADHEAATVAAVLADWRAIARAGGGHATLQWAPLAVKSLVPVWDDAGPAGRIMRRIKAQLDPNNVLNPGRFVAGI